jgi:hypothetical protein
MTADTTTTAKPIQGRLTVCCRERLTAPAVVVSAVVDMTERLPAIAVVFSPQLLALRSHTVLDS